MYYIWALYLSPHIFEIRLLLTTAWDMKWVKFFFVISSLCTNYPTSETKATLYPKGLVFLLSSHF